MNVSLVVIPDFASTAKQKGSAAIKDGPNSCSDNYLLVYPIIGDVAYAFDYFLCINVIKAFNQHRVSFQRAIAAQVEERKRQKEQEALARKIEEEKAERRLEEDRRRLQKQYEMEKNRQREMEVENLSFVVKVMQLLNRSRLWSDVFFEVAILRLLLFN